MALGKKLSYIETVIRNLQSSERFYGFLPPHGKRLKALGDSLKGDYFFFKGDIESFIGRRKRYIDSFQSAVDAGLIRVTENRRTVYYAAVANATAFTKGDLLWWDNSGHLAKPAAAFTWDTNLATTQAEFAAVALGIALDSKAANDGTTVLRVDISEQSSHDLTIASGSAYQIGQSFGPAKDTGNALLSNKVVAAVKASSCMRLAADITSSDTQVLVRFNSVFTPEDLSTQGTQGPQGATGAQGAQGATGAQGAQGPP